MSSSWRDISKYIGVILALSLIAFNLFIGTDILSSLFRGVAAYLVFTILNTLLTTIIYKVIHEFETQRLEDLNQLADELGYDDDEDDLPRAARAEGSAE